MWNSKSPGVETACREPALNSRKGCSFRRSPLTKQSVPCVGPDAHHAGEIPFDFTETDCAEQSREITTNARMTAQLALPELIVATRKIAAFVNV